MVQPVRSIETRKHLDVQVRVALNTDSKAIQQLCESNGFKFNGLDMDWSQIYPFWLVAEIADKIVGCIQVIVAKPVGRIDVMCIDEDLSHRETGQVAKQLTDYSVFVLRGQGCSAAIGHIPKNSVGYRKVAERRGWVSWSDGDLFIKALQ